MLDFNDNDSPTHKDTDATREHLRAALIDRLESVLSSREQEIQVDKAVWHRGQSDEAQLRKLLEDHNRWTGSKRARALLDDWESARGKFIKVFPLEYKRALAEIHAAKAAAPAPQAKASVPAPAAPAPGPDPAAGRFVVQVGAFADDATVRQTRQKVEKLGLKTYTQEVNTEAGKRVRVRLGPFATKEEAAQVLGKLKGAGLPGAVLTL